MIKPLQETVLLHVNGKEHLLDVEVSELLLDVLRDRLGLTGSKKGCETGECGACTVLLDGRPVNSCLVLALDAVGYEITTIEGLSPVDGPLNPVQQAFVDFGAIQCGYCSPGMIMSVTALLAENSAPDDEDIKKAISGHLCRCGSYVKIMDAVRYLSTVRQDENMKMTVELEKRER